MSAGGLAAALCRKKAVSGDGMEASQLSRCLTLLDLTMLGVGSTLGLGVYVLAGAVARSEAGPAVTLSFLVAAVASAFAGLCYAEFAARVPKAGSAYVYSYVCVGEFVAFVIGWNLILEYVIGTASVARGLSNYVDSLTDKVMHDRLIEVMPIRIKFLSEYPDFLAFGIVMLLTGLLAIGVKESTILNNLFTIFNILVIITVIVAGSIKADLKNWRVEPADVPAEVRNVGAGGFMPFGVAGVMAGAAKCFYGFVGFDCVATTGEEAKNPQRSIPIAIVVSLVIIFAAYFGISTVLTLMWPYYDQDPDAPLPYVFMKVGWPVIKWIVTVGAVFALCTSLLGAMFPLPRVLYAMATDGILFRFLADVSPRTQTPILATFVSGTLAGIMATIFDLQQLIDMMSIGTLLAYTIVSICVLVLRYEDRPSASYEFSKKATLTFGSKGRLAVVARALKHLFNLNNLKQPTPTTERIAKWGIAANSVLCVLFCASLVHASSQLAEGEGWAVVLTLVLGVSLVVALVVVGRQPVSGAKLSFKVPLVPLVPGLSILINVYLMMMLDSNTWIRFAIWLVIGFLIYFFYGVGHSEEGKRRQLKALELSSKAHEARGADAAGAEAEVSSPGAGPQV
ncbi:cationic amino acid transporter 2-like [Bacillus rossius redtenbacheri]|uniref:cationic amino acid transporter 2-like n=1 Tax=Bacillus rossius redtenbacheri TaxID=93214 RepID=UPI002FDE7881